MNGQQTMPDQVLLEDLSLSLDGRAFLWSASVFKSVYRILRKRGAPLG